MRLLFLCTGNTCRSPLALAAWDVVHSQVLSTLEGEARSSFEGIMAASAGISASEGAPAASHSQTVAAGWGVNLAGHRSRGLQADHVRGADLILTMTHSQAQAVLSQFRVPSDRVQLLGSFATASENESEARLGPLWGTEQSPVLWAGENEAMDILDPYGGSLEAYQACGEHIRNCVQGLARALGGARA